MDLVIKGKGKKGLIIKTWERCRSLGSIGRKSLSRSRNNGTGLKLKHSKSWPSSAGNKEELEDQKRGRICQVAPEGCFSVCVGPQKQRFVIRTQCLNHPLFKVLLEEAESEYGYNSEGPLELPCDVDLFIKVLMEMDCDHEIPPRCSFGRTYSSYHLLTPPRLLSLHNML